MSEYGPTEVDETCDRYAACPACGDRLTHLRRGDTWHCHSCGCHWREPGGYYSDLPVDDDLLIQECPLQIWDLWE